MIFREIRWLLGNVLLILRIQKPIELMNKKKLDIIFFLSDLGKKNSTLEDRPGFVLYWIVEEEECLEIGDKVFTYSNYNSDAKKVIMEAMMKEHPQCVIGIENTGTYGKDYEIFESVS